MATNTMLTNLTIKELAARIDRRAILQEPDDVVKVLAGTPAYAGVLRHSADRDALLSRDVMKRPHFSPVSIRSHYARLLVNLSRAPVGGRFVDPFCGGGGIIMEAADIGCETTGIDISKDAVKGARVNMEHYGLDASLSSGDISSISGSRSATSPTISR